MALWASKPRLGCDKVTPAPGPREPWHTGQEGRPRWEERAALEAGRSRR